MNASQQHYESLKSKDAKTDDDRRLIKLYESEGYSCHGSNSSQSLVKPSNTDETTKSDNPQHALTTENPSAPGRTGNSTARLTVGSGKASRSK